MAIRLAGARISDFFGDKPDYGALGSQATEEAARNEVSAALRNLETAKTVMSAEADRAAGEHYADATRAGAAAQAQASMGSLAETIGGLGGLFSSGGSSSSMPATGSVRSGWAGIHGDKNPFKDN